MVDNNQIPIEKGIINFYNFLINREVSRHLKYLQVLEKTFRDNDDEINSKINNSDSILVESISDQEYREITLNLKFDLEQNNEFTNWMRQSFILSIYSFLELWLSRDCQLLDKKTEHKFKDIHGNGLIKVKRFRVKHFNDQFDYGTDSDWQWVMRLLYLRNCIAHRSGSLTGYSNFPPDQTLIDFIHDEEYLSQFGINNDEILVDYEFCVKALSIINSLLNKLLIKNNLLNQ